MKCDLKLNIKYYTLIKSTLCICVIPLQSLSCQYVMDHHLTVELKLNLSRCPFFILFWKWKIVNKL